MSAVEPVEGFQVSLFADGTKELSELPALTSPMASSKGRVVRKKPALAKKASKAPSRVKDAIAPTPKPLVLRRVRAKQGPDGQPARAPAPACKQSLIVEFKARHYEDYKERATKPGSLLSS